MKRNLLTHIAAAAALTIAAGSAAAQASDPATGSQGPQGEARGHVAVDISALRGDLAQRMNMAESEVPSTIRLPVGQAAQLCGVPASELAPPQGAAAAACTATEASTELQVAVRRELDQRGSPTGSVPSGTTTGSATDPTTTGSATGATTGTSPGTTTGSATAESTTGSAATGTTSGGASADVSSGATTGSATSETTTGSATSETTTGSATSETTTGSASTGSATAGTATGSTAADASSAGAATVAVDIGAIRDQLAQRLNVEPTRLPSTVRVGVDIAASACALPASQLTAAQPQGAPACSATQLSPELQSAVQQQLTGG